MKSAGYTFIELLVVISIISIMSISGFVYFKNFSQDQMIAKAIGQIQTYFRLAQSNATASTNCPNPAATKGVISWFITLSDTTIKLGCNTTDKSGNSYILSNKTYTLENAKVDSVIGADCGATSSVSTTSSLTLVFSTGSGSLSFSSSSDTSTCLASDTWAFTVKNTSDTGSCDDSPNNCKKFTISKGGAINVAQ